MMLENYRRTAPVPWQAGQTLPPLQYAKIVVRFPRHPASMGLWRQSPYIPYPYSGL